MESNNKATAFAVVNHEGEARVYSTIGRVVDFLRERGVAARDEHDNALTTGHELRFEIETCRTARFYSVGSLPGGKRVPLTLRYRVTEHYLSTGERRD